MTLTLAIEAEPNSPEMEISPLIAWHEASSSKSAWAVAVKVSEKEQPEAIETEVVDVNEAAKINTQMKIQRNLMLVKRNSK